ncbi:transposase [Rubrivirga sp. S365]|uniref:transposase n=1 Tax=Rubrivirga sp. S365 TaxID=3076080 RepID=UPI00391F741F
MTAECLVGRSRSAPAVHWPVSARLYLPDSWVHDEPRRRRAYVPAGVPKLSKIEIALELVDRAVAPPPTAAEGVPFRLVTADAAYGHFGTSSAGSTTAGSSTPAPSRRASASAGPTRSAPPATVRPRRGNRGPVGSRSGTRPRSTGLTGSSLRSRRRLGRK